MANEAWLDSGECVKCRRRPYCSHRCGANRRAVRKLFNELLAKAQVKERGEADKRTENTE